MGGSYIPNKEAVMGYARQAFSLTGGKQK